MADELFAHLMPLQACAYRGDLAGCQRLVELAAPLDACDVPVADADLALISDEPRELVTHSLVGTEYEGYSPRSNGITALMIAIVKRHWDVATYLLSRGANPNIPEHPADGGWRALHLAARHAEIAFLDALCTAGARLDDHTIHGIRDEAIRFGRADVIEWLVVQKRIAIDRHFQFRTLLMESEAAGATRISAFLRSRGAAEPSCPFCRSRAIRHRHAIEPDGGIVGWFCDACGQNC